VVTQKLKGKMTSHHNDVKRFKRVLRLVNSLSLFISVLFLLSACGGNGEVLTSTTQGNTTPVPQQIEVTDTSGPTTTVPLISQSALPKMVDCPLNRISEDTNEIFNDGLTCASDWAVGWPKSVLDNMSGETENEGQWVLMKTETKWKVLGVCNVYEPIYAGGDTCNNPYNDNPVDVTLIPPMPVQCVLWFGASLPRTIPETGCPNSR
jgi:hypothetical protein